MDLLLFLLVWQNDRRFEGFGGAPNLSDIIGTIRTWVEARQLTRCQLAKNRLSNNGGSVKYFWGALVRALRRARLKPLLLLYQPRLARNLVSGQELSPTHASLRSQLRS